MEIRNNQPLGEMPNLGAFAGKREEIVKEADLSQEKLDAFRSTDYRDRQDIEASKDTGKHLSSLFKSTSAKPKSSLDMEGFMIPANEGRIKHLVLTMGNIGSISDNYMTAMKTFVSKMPQAKFTILTRNRTDMKEAQKAIDEWAEKGVIEHPERVTVADTGKTFSIWAQDSTLVKGNHLVEQDRMWFPGGDDGKLASEVTKRNPELKYERMEGIYVDGGNQVATRDKLFIGSDAVAFMLKNMKKYPTKYEKIAADLKIDTPDKMQPEDLAKAMIDRTFPHQKTIIVGYKGEQPAFHIDMAVTPLSKPDPETGKPVIIVGDPSIAIDTLSKLKEKDPQKYQQYQENIQKKISYAPSDSLDQMVDTLKENTGLQENFDSIAKGLEKDGYKVDRVPFLGSSSLRSMPWITYNNSIFDGNNIFIPNFDMPELDDPANNVYRKYGMNPVPIDMTAISSMQGAINCITKVVEREYSA